MGYLDELMGPIRVNPLGLDDPTEGYPKRFSVRGPNGDMVEYEIAAPGSIPKPVMPSPIPQSDRLTQIINSVGDKGREAIQTLEGPETQDLRDPQTGAVELDRLRGIGPMLRAFQDPVSEAYGPETHRKLIEDLAGGPPESGLGAVSQAAAEKALQFGSSPMLAMFPSMGRAGSVAFGTLAAEGAGTSLAKASDLASDPNVPMNEVWRELTHGTIDAALAPSMFAHSLKSEPVIEPTVFTDFEKELFKAPSKVGAAPISPFDKLESERSANDIYNERFKNIVTQFVERVKPEVAKTFGDPSVQNIKVKIDTNPERIAEFLPESDTILINPDYFKDMSPREITNGILHEIAHTKELHELMGASRDPVTGEERGYIPVGESSFAEVDPEILNHTWENINERSKVSRREHQFQTGQDSLFNNPEIRKIGEHFEKNIAALNVPEFRRSRGLPSLEAEGEEPLPVSAAPETISPEANNLRKILNKLKLRNFDLETLPDEAEKLGVSLFKTEEYKPRIKELIDELKDKGWVKEKLGGKYELMSIPPDKFEAWKARKQAEGTWNPKKINPESIEPFTPVSESIAPRTEPVSEPLSQSEPVSIPFEEPRTTSRVGTPEFAQEVRNQVKTGVDIKAQDSNFREQNLLNRYEDGVITLSQLEKGYEQIGKKLPEEFMLKEMNRVTQERTPAEGPKFTDEEFQKKFKELPAEDQTALRKAFGKTFGKKPPKVKEPIPPKEVTEGEEGRPQNYQVTLSDGSEHVVRATSKQSAMDDVQEILDKHGSSKTIDKVEEHPSRLERAAMYETDPLKTGMEEVSDEISGVRTEARLREAAHEKELRDKLKVEEDFKKAEEKRKAKSERERARAAAKAREAGEGGFINNPIVRVFSAAKSLAFGGDAGHFLRQGKQMTADLLFSKHYRQAFKQFALTPKLAVSDDALVKLNQQLYEQPAVQLLVDKFGLDMPGLGKGFKEEVFHGGDLAEKIPLIGKYYAKPSERIYTGGLNFLRAAEATKFVENLQKRGFTPENAPEKYKAVAAAINIISQRGNFNPAYTKVLSDASAFYGAPRAKMARLQNAFTLFKAGETGDVVRTAAAKTMAFNAIVYGTLMATAGGEFITDPKRSDFLKIRLNDKISIDPWVGLGVTARTVAKLLEGETTSPYTGKTRSISGAEAAETEFLGGIAPGVRLLYELYKGQDIRGYQVSRWESLLNVAPLTARNIAELLSTGDIEEAFLLSVLQFGGEGIDVFDYKAAQEKERKLKIERGLPVSKKKKKGSNDFYFPLQ